MSIITLLTLFLNPCGDAPASQCPMRDNIRVVQATDAANPSAWLFGPGERTIALDPTRFLRDLLNSPLRHAAHAEMTRALCVVVLLESSDETANRAARAKAEAVLARVNRERAGFDKAPPGEIKLLTLTIKQRPQERWTLWSLGEAAAASATPKIAVFCGAMRRAGPLLEGVAWPEDELFMHIAALGRWGERRLGDGPALPFAWQMPLANQLPFDPAHAVMQRDLAAVMQEAHGDHGVMPLHALLAGLHQPPVEDEEQPAGVDDPLRPVHVEPAEHDAEARKAPAYPALTPSLMSSQSVAVVLLIAGVVGWLALFAAFLLLLSRQPQANPS